MKIYAVYNACTSSFNGFFSTKENAKKAIGEELEIELDTHYYNH